MGSLSLHSGEAEGEEGKRRGERRAELTEATQLLLTRTIWRDLCRALVPRILADQVVREDITQSI